MSKRFRVALSYPGEHRSFVAVVAADLAGQLTVEKVFYDRNFVAELARPNLDTYLQQIYQHDAALIVIFLCQDYERKEWCHLEWRVVRELIKQRRDDEVMFVRVGDGEIPGLLSIDGYIDARERTPTEVAKEILRRLQRIEKPADSARDRDAPVDVSLIHLPTVGEFLIGREREYARLDTAWERPGEFLISVVARGGEGKTNLIRHWLNRMASAGWRGAEKVFGWSFFSQGTNNKAANAEEFLQKALAFFGEDDPGRFTTPEERGERLAFLAGSGRNLLILDGLEPMQYPPGPMEGRLKDPALYVLMSGLMGRNGGLCVITTREALPELAGGKDSVSPEIVLPALSPAAGAALLEKLGVDGTVQQREEVSVWLAGHALSIQLLGKFLSEVHGGDVTRAREVAFLEEGGDAAKRARQILSSYEKWLSADTLSAQDATPEERAEIEKTGRRMLAVLRLIGLFDRPAGVQLMEALRAAPVIPGLTEDLVGISRADWARTLAKLRRLGLVNAESAEPEDAALDAHPLIREYFGVQLAKRYPDAAREAHRRLYEYLKNSVPDQPDDLQGLLVLYDAVVHGCKAGLYEEAFDDVFFRRIHRYVEYFPLNRFGASGANLAAFGAFFRIPWSEIAAGVPDRLRGGLFAGAGFDLRDLGRLDDARDAMKASLEERVRIGQYAEAATPAYNLGELSVILADIAAALRYGEQAIELADCSGDNAKQHASRRSYGEFLHHAGAHDQALVAFRIAEEIYNEISRGQFLFGTVGWAHINLLLDVAVNRFAESEHREMPAVLLERLSAELRPIRNRSSENLRSSKETHALHTKGYDHLGEARVLWVEARLHLRYGGAAEEAIDLLREAPVRLNRAVTLLRQSGAHYFVTEGLLQRVAIHRLLQRVDPANGESHRALADQDLAEAEGIADRVSMLRWKVEATLGRVHQSVAAGDFEAARRRLETLKQLVKRTERVFEPHEPLRDDWEKPSFVGVFKKGDLVRYTRCDREIAWLEEELRNR